MSEDSDKIDGSRRDFLRYTTGMSLVTGITGVSLNQLSDKAKAATSYQSHQEDLFDSHGDLIRSSYLTGDDLRPKADTMSPPKCEGVEPSCGGGGGGTSTTDDGDDGGGGGGGGGGSTPEPNEDPKARISSAAHVAVDTATTFSGENSSDGDGYVSSYAWDFDDGSGASGETVTHTYSNTGTYNVTLTVTDNDGATDSVTKTVTVGNQWRVSQEYNDNKTINEDGLEIGDGIWEVISGGEKFVHEITESVKDGVDSFLSGSLGNANSKFQYPVGNSPISISMDSGSSYSISPNNVDVGDSWIGGFAPDWAAANIPFAEISYADWESGLAEAAATTTIGAAYGMSVVCAEFTPSLSSTKSGYATVNYDWSTHLMALVGRSEIYVSPFARNVTEDSAHMIDDTHKSKSLFALDLEGDLQLPSVWYGNGSESATVAMTDNEETDLRFKDGHKYQVGVRLLINTGAADKKGGVTGRGFCVDSTSDHTNPAGSKWLTSVDLADDVQNGVEVNSIEIEW